MLFITICLTGIIVIRIIHRLASLAILFFYNANNQEILNFWSNYYDTAT